jgi:1,4-dihydroxy-2-naphthoate polyprenyltransferase
MNKVQIWTLAARPKTLLAGISPVLIGATMALSQGYFDSRMFTMTILTALGIQIGTNFANDYFDFLKGADTADRKGPLRVTQSGLVSLHAMKRGIFLCFVATFLSGCYLIWHGGLVIAFLLALSILLGLLYTGGPFPLAYLGLGDVFVFIFFGPIAVASTYYLQAHHFSWTSFLAGLAPGALSTAIIIVNNIRDIEEDRTAAKKTLAVRFGKNFGRMQYLSVMIVAAIVPLFFVHTRPFCCIAILFLLPALPLIKAVFSESPSAVLNIVLGKTGQVLLIYSLLFCIGWMI